MIMRIWNHNCMPYLLIVPFFGLLKCKVRKSMVKPWPYLVFELPLTSCYTWLRFVFLIFDFLFFFPLTKLWSYITYVTCPNFAQKCKCLYNKVPIRSQTEVGAPTLKVTKFGETCSVYESYGPDQIIWMAYFYFLWLIKPNARSLCNWSDYLHIQFGMWSVLSPKQNFYGLPCASEFRESLVLSWTWFYLLGLWEGIDANERTSHLSRVETWLLYICSWFTSNVPLRLTLNMGSLKLIQMSNQPPKQNAPRYLLF
jgi:hypothetical protein